jgi:hypothetical protein
MIVDVTAKTGHALSNGTGVTSWQVPDGPYIVEHFAGVDASGHLLVFFWSPRADWQAVDVTAKTGRTLATGSGVTSWQVPDGRFIVEHLAGVDASGHLLVFFWSPRADWQAVDVTAKTGRTLATGSGVTSWQVPDGPNIVEHLAGVDASGHLLVFFWSPRADWQAVDVTAKTGHQLAAGSRVTSWKRNEGQAIAEHVAGLDPAGHLIVPWWLPWADWQAVDLFTMDGHRLSAGSGLTSWQTPDGLDTVEHLGAVGIDGHVLVFWWRNGEIFQNAVVTQHNNNRRTGAHLAERELTPAAVASPGRFGRLYEREVQGDVYAQPLYVPRVNTRSGRKNLFFIATSTNDVYAFDADDTNPDPYAGRVWHRCLNPWRPLVINREICAETVGSVGITSTPVIDVASQTMYVVTRRSGGRIVASGGQLYQLHNDGKIWRYTGPPISGWQLLDNNPATIQIAASWSDPGLFQLHRDGKIWRYTGTPLTGWQMIDNNPVSAGIAAAGVSGGAWLYQIHETGSIWGASSSSPPGTWTELDNNPLTTQIVAATTIGGTILYQLHRDGTIWKYTGPPISGWQLLDNNPATVQIAATGPDLYQLHRDGTIWRYTGPPISGWQLVDNNPATTHIAAAPTAGWGGSTLYQLHTDGTIWKYTGPPISGWQLLDNNPATAQIVVDNTADTLYQIHIDGTIWRYTGPPLTGWQMLDNNWALNDGANYLHAVNITDGTERRPPVRIQGTDPRNPAVRFDSRCQRNRPGLLLLNGVVYLAFGTFSCDAGSPDGGPYHGWVLGYRASDLSQVAVYCTSPDGGAAGIWQSGAGLVAGDDGSIYFETGNDDPGRHARLGDSFIKLRPISSPPGLMEAGHFTPSNAAILRDGGPLSPAAAAWSGNPRGPGDTDLGSGGPVFLPGGRLVGGGKQGRYYVINAATMALSQDATPGPDGLEGFQAFENTWHPTFTHRDYEMGELFGPNIHGNPIYWTGTNYVYQMPEKDYLKAFRYHPATGVFQETPAVTASGSWARPRDGMPGGFSSISANGDSNGIIWTSLPQRDGQWTKVPGVLAAFDATTLVQRWSDDSAISFAKFCPPTIANGKVIRATFASDVHHGVPGKVVVYGLRTRPTPIPTPMVEPAPGPIPPSGPDPSPGGRATASAATRQATLSATALRHPAIDRAYWAHNGPHGTLGTPVGEEQSIGDAAGGRFRDYESVVRGSPLAQASARVAASPDLATCHAPTAGEPFKLRSAIYWSAETGAHVVEGEILTLWRQLGAEKSAMGYPISDETNTPDALGRVSHFRHGDIVWHPETGAVVQKTSAQGGIPNRTG